MDDDIRCSYVLSGERPTRTPARVTTAGTLAPAAVRARTASAAVAPVVSTSSTTTHVSPDMSRARRLPRSARARWILPRPFWVPLPATARYVRAGAMCDRGGRAAPVSYTHLTLPTILLV